MKTITITMDDLGKPITFGLGLVVGIAASSITLYALSSRDTDDEIKSITSNRSNKENKATQTVPIPLPSPEPKVSCNDQSCVHIFNLIVYIMIAFNRS